MESALFELVALVDGDFDGTLRAILRADAQSLSVDGVGYWELCDGDTLVCRAKYQPDTEVFTQGMQVPVEANAAFLHSLRKGRIVRSREIRMSDSMAPLLEPAGAALLCVPVLADGTLAGLLTHEHSNGPRAWTMLEQEFAMAVGQLVARAIETQSRKQIAEALSERDALLKNLVDASLDAIVTVDGSSRILEWNAQASQVFRVTRDKALGLSFAELVFPDDMRTVFAEGLAGAARGEPWDWIGTHRETTARRGDSLFDAEVAIARTRLDGRHIFHIFVRDITQRKRDEKRLYDYAFRDQLTHLWNRTHFEQQLQHEIERARRTLTRRFAVLFLDLDGFKLVNDSFGHNAGDDLLVEVARRIRSCVRASDVAARLGGDEFAVLLSDLSDTAQAIHLADRIGEVVAQPITVHGKEVIVSSSIGIVLGGDAHQDPSSVLRDADAAMYRAKANGKGRYEVFDVRMHVETVQRLELETDLRRAVERGELSTSYQPIVWLGSGQIAGFEVFLRWRRRDGRVLLPRDFLRAAEDTGAIEAMGFWLLDTACAHLSRWRARMPALEFSLSVNLSRVQLRSEALPKRVGEIASRHGLLPSCLRFELPESALVADDPDLLQVVERLPGGKCVDNFGTGPSSLGSLHRLPIDCLKIDRSFVAELGSTLDLVRAMLGLSHSLGMKAIAQGIETNGQLFTLRAIGCDMGQGRVLADPMAAADVDAMLDRFADGVIIV